MLEDFHFVVLVDCNVGIAGAEVDSNGGTLAGLFGRYQQILSFVGLHKRDMVIFEASRIGAI